MTTAVLANDMLWSAVAEPSRRRLIDLLLRHGEATASTLAHEVPFSRQAVAKHLTVLEKAAVVHATQYGREVRFAVQPDVLAQVAEEMTRTALEWDVRLARIKRIAEALHEDM
ncbi:MAG TPA: helix-turn-helix domain-containing protein [Candidatus Saccharimonadales bacterium]|nr:helix-turn-helix domain-containing protein [Candidatus Saccharimonadales bacterium]